MKYLFRLQNGKNGYDWFNLESKSHSKCPSISCSSFTSREDLEIEISPIVVHCRSTPPPFFVDGNCVDGNWLPTVILDRLTHERHLIIPEVSRAPGTTTPRNFHGALGSLPNITSCSWPQGGLSPRGPQCGKGPDTWYFLGQLLWKDLILTINFC